MVLRNILLWSVFCFELASSMDTSKWSSIKIPRSLAQEISFCRKDNETVRPLAKEAISKLNSPTPQSISILWAGKEAFNQIDNVIAFECEKQIQLLKNKDLSNFWIGSMLLRSQTTQNGNELIKDFDIDIAMAGISFLENEKNGKKQEAIKLLKKIQPAMEKIGRKVLIDD